MTAPNDTAPALSELVQSYLDLWWSLDPVAATSQGVTGHDHRLGSFGTDDLRRHLAALRSLGAALEGCDLESLHDEIDRTALLDEIRCTLHRFEHEQPQVRNPTFWISHLLEGLYHLLALSHRPRAERARAAAGRVRAVPGFLAEARGMLRECPRVFVQTAIEVAAQGTRLLSEVRRELVPEGDTEFPAACEQAEAAVEDFAAFLRDDLLDGADGSFAIGEAAFNFRLHYQHALRHTAPEVWRYGLSLVETVEAEVAALARRIDAERPWQDTVSRLRADHADAGDLVGAYAQEMERARGFVMAQGLVTVPSGALEVVATPAFLQPLIPFAAYQPPGAFAAERRGWFYVTAPSPGADPQEAERALRDHCTHELPSTALHESYPGHHLQFLVSHAQPRMVRKVLGSPLTVEGWALYCEEMMGEQGFYSSVEERLFQKVALLWRACRVVLDVGLHTRGLSMQHAVEYLAGRLGFERLHAEAEVRRYCAEPAYQLCYAVGCRDLLALREAWRSARGSSFELRDFHDTVLQYGGLPVSLIRWGMGVDE